MKSGESNPKKDRWFQDMLIYSSGFWTAYFPMIMVAILAVLSWVMLALIAQFKQRTQPENAVIIYSAQDQDFAEPMLRAFEKETGIKVRAVYDSEAVKTVGLANRLLAERAHPQADVFWGNEEFRTRQLAAAGVFAGSGRSAGVPTRSGLARGKSPGIPAPPDRTQPAAGEDTRAPAAWTPLTGYQRMRMLVVNTHLVKPDTAPRSLNDLTNATWRGKVALAYPLFGTTATHFLALRQAWGEARWLDWCRALAANKPFVVDGNSVVVNLVGRGEAWIGLTDSDDIAAGQREGLPIAAASLGDDTLRIPNTVAIVHGAPHRANAEKLITYLNRPDVKERLAKANAFSPVKPEEPRGLPVDWATLLADQEKAVSGLKAVFLR